ncbi:MAG: HAMP domain-containing histidine kinase [Anaerolineae bacterium]|nr:HAMP domain-containing histidine kinase [Anaerolineae bacterium]
MILFVARPLRAVIDTLIATFVVVLIIWSEPTAPIILRYSAIWFGSIGVLVCAVRLRFGSQSLAKALLEDAFVGACACIVTSALLVYLAPTTPPSYAGNYFLISCLLLFLMYAGIRPSLRIWQMWQRTRQKHLRWSIAQAQFMLILLVSIGLLISQASQFAGIRGVDGLPIQFTTLASSLLGIVAILTHITFVTIVGIPVIFGLMGIGIAASTFIARPTTRRIEALAAATTQLRNGDYGARIAVTGEDEIAQLQQDFNAMAAELERALTSLKQERDTVTGLLQTRRELMAAVSHELRTPIAGIRGYVESALANWQMPETPPPTLRADLEKVESEAQQLGRLIDDLFTLSRAEVGKLTLRIEPTDAAALIRSMVDISAPLAWRNQRVSVAADVTSDLPKVMADSTRLEQILLNLIHNALRHTPPGGIVALAARVEADRVRIEVRDTGEGIPADELTRLWDRFYRGEKGDGAGLGLSIVKELVEAMGGTVSVSSTIGQGSIFSLTLRQVYDNSAESR